MQSFIQKYKGSVLFAITMTTSLRIEFAHHWTDDDSIARNENQFSPDELCISSPDRVCWGTLRRHQLRMWNSPETNIKVDFAHTLVISRLLTPRSFSPHPATSLSGSDHSKSHSSPADNNHVNKRILRRILWCWPVSGTSVGLMIRLICSMLWRSGLSPPWQQKIFSSTMAAMGKQLKQSVNVFHSLMLYRLLPELCCVNVIT